MEIDLLCVGHASFDLVMPVDHHPGPDEKCFASDLVGVGGGPAANAAVCAARLGGRSAFAGYLGLDQFGNRHFEELRSDGVETALVVRGRFPTALSLILVKPDGKRTVVTYKGATPVLEPGHVDFSRIRPKAVLFDGHEPAISVPLAVDARSRGIITVLDAGSVHTGTVELTPLCDFVVASEKFAAQFCGQKHAIDAVAELARIAPVAVVTMGDKGLAWRSGGESGSLPAFKVEAVDTTGAGDVFHGAFALRVAAGDGLPAALDYASATAALSCTRMGARPGIPTAREVSDFLAKMRKKIANDTDSRSR